MVGKFANRISAVPFHSILSSGNCRLSPSGRWHERRKDLIQFAQSPAINSVRSIASELRNPSRRVVGVQVEILFELRDCGPSCLWRARLTTLRLFEPFVQIRELRRPVTPRHQRSVPYGIPNYVV
jgi:hypothetical protein